MKKALTIVGLIAMILAMVAAAYFSIPMYKVLWPYTMRVYKALIDWRLIVSLGVAIAGLAAFMVGTLKKA